MKTCKQCSLCIGSGICDLKVTPNSGRCVVFIQLVEKKLTAHNKQKLSCSVCGKREGTVLLCAVCNDMRVHGIE